jgi:hypothetical protein
MAGAYDRPVTIPPGAGWFVLALVFLDELLVMAALAVWGADTGGWLLAVLAAAAGVVVWFLFASPKARYGGPVARPVAKVLVIGAGVVGLAVAGHVGWAVALASVLRGGERAGDASGHRPAADRRGRRPVTAPCPITQPGGECQERRCRQGAALVMGGAHVRTLHDDQR